MIGVTGATGALGGRVARRLAERGVEQRLVVRDAARAPSLPHAEVARRRRATHDGDAMARAFAGVDTLLLVSAGEHPDRVSLHRSAVDAAAAARVAAGRLHLVPRRRARRHLHVRAATTSTPRSTSAPPGSASRSCATRCTSTTSRSSPPPTASSAARRGDGRVGAVARDDVADAAVAALLDAQHEGRAYEVTGREAYTLAEAAQILTQFTGREVVYVEETLEEARASRAPSGAPDWEIEGWVTSYAAVAEGTLDVVTDTVARLTGHDPMTLPEFLEAQPDSWAHLRL